MTQRPQEQQPRRAVKDAHADRNAPQPGHEAGSSGTSEYGRSDYGEPSDHEPEGNDESSRAAPDVSEAQQSQSQQSSGPVAPTRAPLNHRH